MTLTSHRVIQYVVILLMLSLFGGAYWYFSARAAVNLKTAAKTGLVGYWSFDEGSGTQAGDVSGSGNTGTLTSGPTWTTGKLGQAISFDGTNDYVDIGAPSSLTSLQVPMTISGWFKQTASSPSLQPIFAQYKSTSGGGLVKLIRLDNGVLKYYTSNSSGGYQSDGTFTPSLNTWHFFAVTISGSIAVPVGTIYLDGASQGISLSALSSSPDTTAKIYIGSDEATGNERFKGQIDDVRIYNRALSAAEISNAYALGAAKLNTSQNSSLTDGLVGLWSFNGADVSGTTAYDRSGSANNGTLTNGPTATIGKVGQALTFNGTNQSVYKSAFSPSFHGATAITMSAWIKANAGISSGVPFYYPNGGSSQAAGLVVISGTSVRFDAVSAGTNVAVSNITGGWHLMTMTWDGTTKKGYLDGVLIQSEAKTGTISTSLNEINIGRFSSSNVNFFPGSIDEVRVYNRALSAAEIQSLYDLGASNKLNTSQNTQATNGLVGLWSFNGADVSGTTAYDRSESGNNGTLTNGPAATIGKVGQALSLDGTNDKMTTATNQGNGSNVKIFTLSAWFKTSSASGKKIIGLEINQTGTGSGSYDRQIYIGTDGKVYFYIWDGASKTAVSSATFTDNNWHHAVAVSTGDSGSITLYVDGALQQTTAVGSIYASYSTSYWRIGGYKGSGATNGVDGYFLGSIDEVRIYNRALTATEITALYNHGR